MSISILLSLFLHLSILLQRWNPPCSRRESMRGSATMTTTTTTTFVNSHTDDFKDTWKHSPNDENWDIMGKSDIVNYIVVATRMTRLVSRSLPLSMENADEWEEIFFYRFTGIIYKFKYTNSFTFVSSRPFTKVFLL